MANGKTYVWVENKDTGLKFEVTDEHAAYLIKHGESAYALVDVEATVDNAGAGGNDGDDNNPPITPEMVDDMKYDELKELAGQLQLAKSGNKDELAERIKAKLAEVAAQ